ncbi:hypothetical protein DFR24_3340 [Panacagrimonas perspica]|uniref:Uncharacterized protein n=1 Tax=Panacagrimonas perspica TaxID=381431 RepID=A0A4S3K2K6_9GAMM|nr:hypothetical protein [Panacagrimonas perspica]TDU28958.1 hypothetical protein DFR24_3340 [Panacagrimonas perspica]THD02223.1 hypothetical protein B1810_14920 [Panacagrimonas perspica]
MKGIRVAALPLLLLTACASLNGEDADVVDPFQGWFEEFRTCRQEYADMDARVEAAGKGNGAYYRVPGYPYFRTDRITASMAREVRTIDEIGGWMRRMREFDQEARDVEYRNLGFTAHQTAESNLRFHGCGGALAAVEFMDDPDALKRLVDAVQPPDEYSTLQRIVGLYAVDAPRMKARVAAYQHTLDEAYRQSLVRRSGQATPTLWKPQLEGDVSDISSFEVGAITDELGFPALTDGQWRALTLAHAPHLLIETASEHDVLAQPVLTASGAAAEISQHRVHYYITFTRVGHRVLPQFNYFFWFRGEGEGAPLDGFIWRVTLDGDAHPLVYERIHTSGYGHEWYPVQPLVSRAGENLEEPPVIAPEPAPGRLPTLRLQAHSHAVQRVAALSDVEGATEKTYEIVRLEDLFMMPSPSGGTQSLFGPDGLVKGPHGPDPIGGRSSGIHEPGALRQLGRHAIAHVGRAHFDDPFLLESVFHVPEQSPLRPIAGPLFDRSTLSR